MAETTQDVTRVAIGEVVEAVLDAQGAGRVDDVEGLIGAGVGEGPSSAGVEQPLTAQGSVPSAS